ncbi:MAG: cation transporter [candidate division Zixibacteria bacterium]|nr:cation transporter [candidate division Zixibacteria bacterium]
MFKNLQTPIASTRLSLLINILLLILKLFGGIVGRSQALIADALNSLLDIVANIVVWLGINIANKPPDESHPYGHGNADTLSAIFVALVLIITGGYIGRESYDSIVNHDFSTPTYLATIAAVITIVVKSFLYKYTIKIGNKYRSQAVIANAADHRSDVIVSIGTLIGIVVAQTKYPILDPIAGLWVAFFILKQAVKIIRDNVHTLMSGSPEIARQNDIKDFITNVEGVIKVRWIKGRMVGPDFHMDAAVSVKGDKTVREGHNIARNIKILVKEKFPEVAGILIHIEPDTE